MTNAQEHGRIIGIVECVGIIADMAKEQVVARQRAWGDVGDTTKSHKESFDERKLKIEEILEKVKRDGAISEDANFAKLLLRLAQFCLNCKFPPPCLRPKE